MWRITEIVKEGRIIFSPLPFVSLLLVPANLLIRNWYVHSVVVRACVRGVVRGSPLGVAK